MMTDTTLGSELHSFAAVNDLSLEIAGAECLDVDYDQKGDTINEDQGVNGMETVEMQCACCSRPTTPTPPAGCREMWATGSGSTKPALSSAGISPPTKQVAHTNLTKTPSNA